MYLPEKFTRRMKQILGEAEYRLYLESFEKQSSHGLRINTLKISCSEFEQKSPFQLKHIPWTSNGYYFRDEDQPAKHPYYYAGLYYLQEPSAMTPAACLPIEDGDKVLDLCAAPGGKATELGARLRGTGFLAANDISSSRAKGLLKNMELMGISNTLVTCETPERLLSYYPEYFDKILIDAPCSGEGMFRKDPSMVKSWENHGPEFYAPLQKEIIRIAAQMLKPGGMLLYSTCTFSLEENEEVIQYLLSLNPSFCLQTLPEYEGFSPGRPDLVSGLSDAPESLFYQSNVQELSKCVRIWPHKMNGEGHFLALLKREDLKTAEFQGTEQKHIALRTESLVTGFRKKQKGNQIQKIKTDSDLNIVIDFMKTFGISLVFGSMFSAEIRTLHESEDPSPGDHLHDSESTQNPLEYDSANLVVYDRKAYMLPEGLSSIRGMRFLRTGLYLGEIKKNRFEPSQALAMALDKKNFDSIIDMPVQDIRVLKYLKGETIDVSDLTVKRSSGWQLVCVDGHPMGFGKLAGGILKNKYYPGWRWQS